MDNDGQQGEPETGSVSLGAGTPDTWLSAIRGLRYNPLAQSYKLVQSRKDKRALIYWWIASLLISGAAAAIQFHHAMPLVKSGYLWIGQMWSRTVLMILQLFWLLWLPRALYLACANWLGCLNRQQPRANRQLDEYLAYSKLSDRELVVGVAANTFKPLVLPVLFLIALLLAGQWVNAYNTSGLPGLHAPNIKAQLGAEYNEQLSTARNMWQLSVKELPVPTLISAASLTAGAVLAVVNLYLLLLGIGSRNVSPIFVSIEAGLITGWQTVWVLVALTIDSPLTQALLDVARMKSLLWGNMNAITAALLLFSLVLGLLLLMPTVWNAFKGILVIITGAFQTAFTLKFMPVFGGWMYGEMTALKSFAISFIALCSAITLVNPLLLTKGSIALVRAVSTPTPPMMVFTYRLSGALFVLAIQLILVPILARFALSSVRLYRQAAE